jgi:hypothetical protein
LFKKPCSPSIVKSEKKTKQMTIYIIILMYFHKRMNNK